MDKYIGRLLENRYEILEVIGTGGMAVVYKARCHRLNRLVAIKILKDDYLEDEEFRRRFHSESQAVAMLSHPNIVSIYDVSSSTEADYIVMELIDGITLKQYMEKKGVLNWKETLHFAIQIAKALEHAHSRGIVHRDIKPHNVMVLKNGSVKVTDFGIARMMSKGNTLTKEALGSVHYISPEQAKGGRVDNRSDIYSLGVVMYEMMSGRPPYDGESPVAVAIQHINGGAAMPSTLNPNIPGGLEQIIMKAMGHEPSERYETATKMLFDLDEFRKNPGILFDYNTPPLDAVTTMPKPPIQMEPLVPPTTTAERVERRNTTPSTNNVMDRKAAVQRQAQRRKKQQEQQRKRNNAAIIAIISCCVVILISLVILFAVLFPKIGGRQTPQQEETIKAPDLIGLVYEDLPKYDDYVIKFTDRKHSEDFPAGQIMEQQPLPGSPIGEDKTIYVVVSMGEAPRVVEMPKLENHVLEEAERILNNLEMDLSLKVEYEYHDEIAANNVIRTDPVSGTVLQVKQEVTIYVSKGKEIIFMMMPENIIGQNVEVAKQLLKNLGLDLVFEVELVNDFEVPMGDVISVDPASGENVRTGQTVTLKVSDGPEVGVVEDLVGKTEEEAIKILTDAKFTNYEIEPVESTKEKGTVLEQSVTAGEEYPTNTKIVLKVSKGEITKKVIITVPSLAELADVGLLEEDYTDAEGNVNFTLWLVQGDTKILLKENVNFETEPIEWEVTISSKQSYELKVNDKFVSIVEVEFEQ